MLDQRHRDELHASGLSDETIEASGIFSDDGRDLPTSPEELDSLGIPSPWIFDSLIEFNFNQPTLEEGFYSFSGDMFYKVLPSCRQSLPRLRKELQRYLKVLEELEGDLSAQLDLFIDPAFRSCAGIKWLEELEKTKGVPEETFIIFLEACGKVKEARLAPKIMAQLTSVPDVPPELAEAVTSKAEYEIVIAMEEFLQAKEALLAELD